MDEVLRFDSLAVTAGDHLPSPLAQLELRIAALEGSGLAGRGVSALAFNSGRSALDALARLLRPDDRVLVQSEVPSVTLRIFAGLAEFDVIVEFTDFGDLERVKVEGASLIFLEVPSSATLQAVDIARVARAAHDAGALLIVDNSLLTAYGCRPLESGADAVVYSSAAALTGDSSLPLGLIVTRSDTLLEKLRVHRDAVGARPNAQSAGSALRGIKTLAVRLKQQFGAAADLLRQLEAHPNIRELHHPSSSADTAFLTRDGRAGGGALLSLSLWNSDAARVFLEQLRLFGVSEWAGGAESTVCQPARSSHRALADLDLALPDSLLRLAIGLEDARDLQAAIHAALEAIAQFTPEPETIEPDQPDGEAAALEIAVPDFMDALSDDALERFERLRGWRDAQASLQGISKLLVLTSGVLQGIAALESPVTLEMLQSVRGLGVRKLERYGDELLSVLAQPAKRWAETLELSSFAPQVSKPRVTKPEVSATTTAAKKKRRRRRKLPGGAGA